MRGGHHEAQMLFQQLGEALGYRYRRTWTRHHPTDGVWLLDTPNLGPAELPVVALEVVVRESGKSLRGSIATLEVVSPAIGILLVQEQEIRRGLIRSGASANAAAAHIERLSVAVAANIARSRQRIALWTFEQLRRRTSLTATTPAA